MKNIIFTISIIIIFFSCKTSSTSTNNDQIPKEISLFNGENLKGWTKYGTEKWSVDNGILYSENGADKAFGYLGTTKEYKNFELNLEFKKTIKSNGGVFIHSQINGTEIKAWQVEIAIPTHFSGGIHEYERGWLVKPELEKDKVIKLDSWNSLKILVKDNTMTTWINGTLMVTLIDDKLATTTGKIALQLHKVSKHVNKLQWRNIKITEL